MLKKLQRESHRAGLTLISWCAKVSRRYAANISRCVQQCDRDRMCATTHLHVCVENSGWHCQWATQILSLLPSFSLSLSHTHNQTQTHTHAYAYAHTHAHTHTHTQSTKGLYGPPRVFCSCTVAARCFQIAPEIFVFCLYTTDIWPSSCGRVRVSRIDQMIGLFCKRAL